MKGDLAHLNEYDTLRVCEACGKTFHRKSHIGRPSKYCSRACNQRAYRRRTGKR